MVRRKDGVRACAEFEGKHGGTPQFDAPTHRHRHGHTDTGMDTDTDTGTDTDTDTHRHGHCQTQRAQDRTVSFNHVWKTTAALLEGLL